MKIFISILTILFCINFSSQVFAANAAGVASIFKITLTKIELCTAVPLDGKNDTTCTGSTTVGTGNKEFDVASVDAGAQVGSFVSTAGLPIGTTFTHAKPTMSREVKVKVMLRLIVIVGAEQSQILLIILQLVNINQYYMAYVKQVKLML